MKERERGRTVWFEIVGNRIAFELVSIGDIETVAEEY